MAGQNKIRWNRLVVTALFTAVFVLSSLMFMVPKAFADGTFNWQDTNTIKGTALPSSWSSTGDTAYNFQCASNGGGKYTCTATPRPGVCPVVLTIDGDSSSGTIKYHDFVVRTGTCSATTTSVAVTIGATANAPSDLTDQGAAGGAAGTGDDPNLECGDNPLTWFLCPIVKMVNLMVNSLDSLINHLLTVDQTAIFSQTTDSGKAYYAAWQTFRGFALAILIIAGLAMVTAQALGFEVLDAYTIKKVLPRLIIAVIGIALSWELMRFFVVLTNDLGLGIRHIIYAPFTTLLANSPLQLGGTASIAVYFLTGVALFTLGVAALLSFGLTALLALFVAFLVLVVRQLIIIVLVLFAPIAIACFVLPNTQSVWKLWHESFTKALLMFPIIVAFLAVGRVFAIISISGAASGIGPSAVNQLIGFAAYFLPYFLIPFTFRFAGGALRTIGGGINDRGRGGFDRLKKYRGGKVSQNMMAAKSGERFNNNALNTLTARATTSRLGLGRRGREAYDQKMALASGEFAQSGKAKSVMFKDNVLQAMSYSSANEARNRLGQDYGMNEQQAEAAIAGVKANGGFGKNRQVWAAKQLAATGTGYADDTQMFSTIARVSGGNKELADSMWGEMRGTSERAGRNDLKSAYSMGSDLLSEMIDNGDARASAPAIAERYQDRFDALGVDAARGVDGMTLARNKPASVRNLMKRLDQSRVRHEARLQDPTLNLSPEQRNFSEVTLGQIRAKMENMEGNISYGPEINAEAVQGTRYAVPKRPDQPNIPTEALYTSRRAGVVTGGQPAIDAAAPERSLRADTAYQEERLGRQPYVPGQDTGQQDDEQH